jgi:hypothetical protein
MSSKQFLPCGKEKQKRKEVLPILSRKLSSTPLRRESCMMYHTFEDRMGRKKESFPQIIHPVLLITRITNALPSTLVYT